MPAHDTLPDTDRAATPSEPSPGPAPPAAAKNTLADWADFAVRAVVGHPGIVLLGIATTGLVVGSAVKRFRSRKSAAAPEADTTRK